MKKCFVLNECDGDQMNIGVIFADTTVELNELIRKALDSHFDPQEGTMCVDHIGLDQAIYTHSGSLCFECNFTAETDNETREIELIYTTVYQ